MLGFIGLIHGEQVGWNVNGQVALGYAFAGIVLLGFWLVQRQRGTPTPTEEPTTATIDEMSPPRRWIARRRRADRHDPSGHRVRALRTRARQTLPGPLLPRTTGGVA